MSPRRDKDVLGHQTADALQMGMIPGTDVMRDVEGYHSTHTAGANTQV